MRGTDTRDWLTPGELRVGLGCMRLSTDDDADDDRALETIAAAAAAGITVFDTARSYGDNERLLARALRACGREDGARVVTKGGMARIGTAWVPDGRAKDDPRRLRGQPGGARRAADRPLPPARARPADTVAHVDPRARAARRRGLVRRVGVSNVGRGRLDEALELAPIAAVQVALSVVDDRASAAAWSSAVPRRASP